MARSWPEYDQGSIDRVLQKEGATYQTFTEKQSS